MISRWITKIATAPEYRGEMEATLRQSLCAHLPKPALRRFSDCDILMSNMLNAMQPNIETALVTASTFSESRSLEEFIDSFPIPSPARFQRSVHPAPVQQHCVCSQQALRTYIPLAGQNAVAIIAIRTVLSLPHQVSYLVACEETGTWTIDAEAGSAVGFAFALKIEDAPSEDTPIIGSIEWSADNTEQPADTDTSLYALYAAIVGRKNLRVHHPDTGCIAINWK